MCIFARRMEVYLPLLHSLTYIVYINKNLINFTKYKSLWRIYPAKL